MDPCLQWRLGHEEDKIENIMGLGALTWTTKIIGTVRSSSVAVYKLINII